MVGRWFFLKKRSLVWGTLVNFRGGQPFRRWFWVKWESEWDMCTRAGTLSNAWKRQILEKHLGKHLFENVDAPADLRRYPEAMEGLKKIVDILGNRLFTHSMDVAVDVSCNFWKENGTCPPYKIKVKCLDHNNVVVEDVMISFLPCLMLAQLANNYPQSFSLFPSEGLEAFWEQTRQPSTEGFDHLKPGQKFSGLTSEKRGDFKQFSLGFSRRDDQMSNGYHFAY